MKNFILFFFLISNFYVLGQNESPEDLNFILDDNNKVIWQKVFEVGYGVESLVNDLKSYFENNLFTNSMEPVNNGFAGKSATVKLSSIRGVAMGAYSPYSSFIKIDVKENRYRVSVTDIVFEGIETGVTSGGISISSTTPLTLEDLAVKNTKSEFRKNSAALTLLTTLNTDFNNYFILKQSKIENDDW